MARYKKSRFCYSVDVKINRDYVVFYNLLTDVLVILSKQDLLVLDESSGMLESVNE